MKDLLLLGELPFPGSRLLETYPDQAHEIEHLWYAIWVNYLNNSTTNSLFWYDSLGNTIFNDVVRRLSHHGWITIHSVSFRRWSFIELNEDKLLEYVSPDELIEIKRKYKHAKYVLRNSRATQAKTVQQNGRKKQTGLVRKGFRNAGNTEFKYDTAALKRHEHVVSLNLTKSMDKIREQFPDMRSDAATYDSIVVGILDFHLDNPDKTFTTGESISDARGRAISTCQQKAMNPISSKDARASLVITYK